jgi:hypothetical protein
MATENPQPSSKMADAESKTDTEKRCLEDGRRIVRSTTRLFGQPVVLVPMYRRAKNPRFRKFQTFTLDLMQDEKFIACIGRPNCNVAVLLGNASGGLCTFDFDDDQNAKVFLAANPSFAETLMTTGQRGRNLWFFVEGDFPDSFDVKDGRGGNTVEFRATGRLTVVHGTHPCGYAYRLLQKALPIRIKWPEIKWPSGWSDQLPRQHVTEDAARATKPEAAFPSATRPGQAPTLDPAKLTMISPRPDGSYNARCPACAELGRDATGKHLIVFPNGAFSCIIFRGHSGLDITHRKRIVQLATTTRDFRTTSSAR